MLYFHPKMHQTAWAWQLGSTGGAYSALNLSGMGRAAEEAEGKGREEWAHHRRRRH